jgi:hypothetical protein
VAELTIEELANALGGGKRVGSELRCTCPAHEDANASLDLKRGNKQPIVATCRAGCTQDAVRAALAAKGLSLNGYKEAQPKPRKLVRTLRYEVKDVEGRLVATHKRNEFDDGTKDMPWERDGKSGVGGMPVTSLPLYGSDGLREIPDGAQILVTEGEKPTETLWKRNRYAVGTVCGAGKNKAPPDDSVLAVLKPFEVLLWPDNDGQGRDHMTKIAARLCAMGYKPPRIVNWKDAPPKGDAADFKGTDDEMQALLDAAEVAPDSVAAFAAEANAERGFEANAEGTQRQAGPYLASPRGLFIDQGRAGLIKLANFWSCITQHLKRDDGLEAAHEYEIACHRGNELATVSVPANKFAQMAWVAEKLRPRFILCAGSKVKDQVREATQLFSDFDIPESTIYTAPGWRIFGEQYGYVHGGGVIGIAGDFRIELPSDLAPFALPDAPSGKELIEAVRAALELLRFGPERLAGPLFCVPWRALLKPADFVVWVYGETGAFKTERAALVMQHVGAGFTSKRVYVSLHADSVAAMREKIFLIKDAPCLCDDYRPGLTGLERSTQQQNLDLIMRAAGNIAGRSTLGTDRRLVSGRPPRCLSILTAEDLPYGESTKGRGLLLQVHHGDFLKETLSRHQSAAAKGVFAAATAGFLASLAPKLKSVLERWDIKFAERRNEATGQHARTPGIVADLYMGAELFVEFAIEIYAIPPGDGAVALNTIWNGLLEASAEQAALQISDKPEVRFIELHRAASARGTAI